MLEQKTQLSIKRGFPVANSVLLYLQQVKGWEVSGRGPQNSFREWPGGRGQKIFYHLFLQLFVKGHIPDEGPSTR